MSAYEYKVVPAPARGVRARGLRKAEDRFAHALELLMNRMGGEGWEYQRAETLPSEERQGLTGSTSVFRNVLIFRRPRPGALDEFRPRLLDSPPEAPQDPRGSDEADAADDPPAAEAPRG